VAVLLEAIHAGGATDHTLSERSWEQKVLFWRTSLKTWCEDPAVDFEVSHHAWQWMASQWYYEGPLGKWWMAEKDQAKPQPFLKEGEE
jgi:hypothetical protein